jgi:hypothetical protein
MGLLYDGNEDPDQEEELIEPYEVIELEYKMISATWEMMDFSTLKLDYESDK